MHHEFPSGEWVDLIPLASLRLKHKNRYRTASLSSIPVDDDGDFDKEAARARPGGIPAVNHELAGTRLAALVATCVEKWSYAVPLPEITEGLTVTNVDSPGEADIELADVLEPYRLKLTREPDPKGSITSSPSEPSTEGTGDQTG
jgi:hypothetical protein